MINNNKSHGRIDHIDCYVGQKLRTRRLVLGLSQECIGKALCVSIQQVQKYEKGVNRISGANIYRIAKLLNVPMSYFFDDVEAHIPGSIPTAKQADAMKSDISEREIISLTKAYSKVASSQVRQKITSLISHIAVMA
jgi:transcriptional regulator with XRE-family HTH domain